MSRREERSKLANKKTRKAESNNGEKEQVIIFIRSIESRRELIEEKKQKKSREIVNSLGR